MKGSIVPKITFNPLRLDSSSEDLEGAWIYLAVLTLGVLITLISALSICGTGGGCCGLGKIHVTLLT